MLDFEPRDKTFWDNLARLCDEKLPECNCVQTHPMVVRWLDKIDVTDYPASPQLERFIQAIAVVVRRYVGDYPKPLLDEGWNELSEWTENLVWLGQALQIQLENEQLQTSAPNEVATATDQVRQQFANLWLDQVFLQPPPRNTNSAEQTLACLTTELIYRDPIGVIDGLPNEQEVIGRITYLLKIGGMFQIDLAKDL
jgi:hypothetical protein